MCSIRSLSQLSSPSARLARAAQSRNKILTRKDRSHGSHGLSRDMVAGTATENHPDRKPWLKDGSSSQLSSQGTSWQNNFRESRSHKGEGQECCPNRLIFLGSSSGTCVRLRPAMRQCTANC